jgi:hypothetical protein
MLAIAGKRFCTAQDIERLPDIELSAGQLKVLALVCARLADNR